MKLLEVMSLERVACGEQVGVGPYAMRASSNAIAVWAANGPTHQPFLFAEHDWPQAQQRCVVAMPWFVAVRSRRWRLVEALLPRLRARLLLRIGADEKLLDTLERNIGYWATRHFGGVTISRDESGWWAADADVDRPHYGGSGIERQGVLGVDLLVVPSLRVSALEMIREVVRRVAGDQPEAET